VRYLVKAQEQLYLYLFNIVILNSVPSFMYDLHHRAYNRIYKGRLCLLAHLYKLYL